MRRRFLLVGVVLCAALLSAAGCATSPGRCGERRAESKESPDRKYTVAIVRAKMRLRVSAEETVTHVNLHGGLGEPPPDANGLITSGEVFVVEGARKVNLTWKDAKNLTVECEDCGGQKVLKREPSWNDVRVSFGVK